jgi:hypothetical protein
VQRVRAGGNAHAVAAAQISELVERLPANGPVPLFVGLRPNGEQLSDDGEL